MPLITSSLLSSLRSTPSLPRHTWYFIATVTLSIINRPEEIRNIFEPALQSASSSFSGVRSGDQGEGLNEKDADKEDALMIARKTRDALVKSIPVGGLPKVRYIFPCYYRLGLVEPILF